MRGSVAAAILLAALGGGGWLIAKQVRLWHIGTTIEKLGAIYGDLSQLPRGVQEFGGVKFDVRGIVQLASRAQAYLVEKYPKRVDGIHVKRMCRHLQFLHAAGWSSPEGTSIGQYVIHYSDGQHRVIPIIYSYDVLDWWAVPSEPIATGLTPVWVGANPAVRQANLKLRLYKTSWTNPRPEVTIESIDFISAMADAAPFLIALTVE